MSSLDAPPPTESPFQDPLDEEAPGPPISVPDVGDTGEGGKLKMIVQLVKKCLGVKDIAAMRLSLPASLLEPIPNLEFSQFLDRPDIFAAINDSEDEFMRMLAVVRFVFTKDLKYVHGKVCKPYNSVLGEHFQAHWDIIPLRTSLNASEPPVPVIYTAPAAAASAVSYTTQAAQLAAAKTARHLSAVTGSRSETGSVKSGKSALGTRASTPATHRSPRQGAVQQNLEGGVSNLSLGENAAAIGAAAAAAAAQDDNDDDNDDDDDDNDDSTSSVSDGEFADAQADVAAAAAFGTVITDEDSSSDDQLSKRVRIVYLTEQVSHHPPISAYFASCPARHIELRGIDHISAKVSGATLRVAAGSFNKGIYVDITGGHGQGERYHVSQPTASVNGILRGSFYVTVSDSCIVTCEGPVGEGGTRYRTIIEYKDESWLGKPHFLVEGIIHTYTPGETAHEAWTKCKHVPQNRIVAHLDGSWKHLIRWRYASSFTSRSSTSPSSSSITGVTGTSKPSQPISSTASSRIDLPKSAGEHATLVDLSTLKVIPKGVRPIEKQLPTESRRLWENVTSRLLSKEFGEATKEKVVIEQKQRDDAAERKKRGVEFKPRYFEKDLSRGWSALTEEGKKAVEEEMREPSRYCLELGDEEEEEDVLS